MVGSCLAWAFTAPLRARIRTPVSGQEFKIARRVRMKGERMIRGSGTDGSGDRVTGCDEAGSRVRHGTVGDNRAVMTMSGRGQVG